MKGKKHLGVTAGGGGGGGGGGVGLEAQFGTAKTQGKRGGNTPKGEFRVNLNMVIKAVDINLVNSPHLRSRKGRHQRMDESMVEQKGWDI